MSRATRQPPGQPVFALFRVAAGPRIGHGHLRRAEALAEALGRPACVSIRARVPVETRLRVTSSRAIAEALTLEAPAVLVIDDPDARQALAWCRAARRRSIPVVSLHDLGLARVPSTLAVDGSVTSPARGWPSDRVLRGPEYTVIASPRRGRRRRQVHRVLVSLGGGAQRTRAGAIITALRRRWPTLEIVVPARDRHAVTAIDGVHHAAAPAGLAPVLADVDAAIVGGGLSLYEAIAAGVPAIGVPVVPAQVPTVRAFAARRLAIDGGHARDAVAGGRTVARAFAALQADADWRRHVRREGPRAVDGRGAQRVARAIATLAGPDARA